MPLERSPRAVFPSSGLRGGKVALRLFGEADITPQYLGWLRDPQVVRFSNQRFRLHDEATARAYLAGFGGTDNLFLTVRRLEDGKALGTMTAYVSRAHETADLGILIGEKSAWGQGIGLDAWRTLSNWLLDAAQVRKITAGAAASNRGMLSVMERSGMQLEATRRGQEIIDGRPEDLVYYARFSAA